MKNKNELKQKVTIYDVAKLIGVSHTTVSRVINNVQPAIPVSDKIKNKVREAIKELNYSPSRFRTKRTQNIGFLYCKYYLHNPISDPFYSKVFEGVYNELEKKYNVILSGIEKDGMESGLFPYIVSRGHVDGLILAGKFNNKYIYNLKKTGLPIVLLDYHTGKNDIDSIVTDNKKGGYVATKYLIKLGHRRIGFITNFKNQLSPSFINRFLGYRKALLESGIKYTDTLVEEGDGWSDGGYKAMEKLSKDSTISAVFCANDSLAVYALQYCYQNKIAVPGQISIIGFDDIDACLQVSPALSTIHVQKKEMGIFGAQRLIKMIEGGAMRPRSIKMETKLILRASCSAPKEVRV